MKRKTRKDTTEKRIGREVSDIMNGRPVQGDPFVRDETSEYDIDMNDKSVQRELKRIAKHRRRIERRVAAPYAFISYAFVLIFLSLIIYLIYFNLYRRDSIQNSSYNRRQDTQAKYVVRGNICSADGEVLAKTSSNGKDEVREYPYGRVYAHVVGFTSNGKSGIESFANYELLDSHDSIIDRVVREFKGEKHPGDSVVTTLSSNLQQTCYNVLGDYSGAIVVLDPHTGAVLAMVSKPDFDPNTISEEWKAIVSDETGSQLVNRATQGLYPPGSTFKIVTALSYLKAHGSYDAFSFNCQGSLTEADHTVHCFNGIVHGEENFEQAFANSCNCAFSSIGLDIGADRLRETADMLLFGKKLPCDFHYSKSRFSLAASEGSAAMMQTAFGQGNTVVTPYHMAMIASAVANNGMLMQPQLISRIETSGGRTVRENKSVEYRQVMTAHEASVLKNLMAKVVTDGTASELAGENYTVAGKTGSAEYFTSDGSVGTHSWFVGFSNVEDPDIAVAVLAEDGGSGSQTAVPMAHQIFNAYYYG